MTIQSPPPPSISPRQMNILRIVAAMAWSDGALAEEEVDVMLDRFSSVFVSDSAQKTEICQELRDYLMQNISLEELVPKLQTAEEKELVLRLGYEVIQSSARTPEEDVVNEEESAAYQSLVRLLNLPSETVERLQQEAIAELQQDGNLIDCLTKEIQKFAKS